MGYQDSLYLTPVLTYNIHGNDCLGVGGRYACLLLALELWEGAQDEGEGGQ